MRSQIGCTMNDAIIERGEKMRVRPERNTGFSVPCTAEEKEELRRMAAEKDMTISAYVRWLVKNYPASKRRKAKETEQDG